MNVVSLPMIYINCYAYTCVHISMCMEQNVNGPPHVCISMSNLGHRNGPSVGIFFCDCGRE